MCSLGLVQTEASEGVTNSKRASVRKPLAQVCDLDVSNHAESGSGEPVNRQAIDRQGLERNC
jgi:hypothetical protein